MSLNHDPHGITYAQGMDPDAAWAVTKQQPLASMLALGVTQALASKSKPPVVLCNKVLTIHAGAGELPLKNIDDEARMALAGHQGLLDARGELPSVETEAEARTLATRTAEPWRETLTRLPRGRVLGRAKLVAAFRIGNVVPIHGTRRVYADRKQAARFQAQGRWSDFDGWSGPMAGDFSPGQWAWFFEQAAPVPAAEAVEAKGFGFVWNLKKGLAFRAAEAARPENDPAYWRAVEEQEGRRA